jgi:phosphoserine phosphatase
MPRDDIRLVAFDLDGTLIPDTTVSLSLARHLGHEAELQDPERRFRDGEIGNAVIADFEAERLRGRAVDEVEAVIGRIPLIHGLSETVSALKAHGITALIATITWSFAPRAYQHRFGLDGHCGTEMDEAGGRPTGEVIRYCDEFHKRDYVKAESARLGLRPEQCAAVGDSRSDVPLFAWAGTSLAINAAPAARAAADHAFETSDPRDVLPYLST